MADDPFSNNISEIVAAFLRNGYTVTPVTQADPLPVALPDGPLAVSLPESPLPVVLPDGPLDTVLPTLFPQAWLPTTTVDMRGYSGAKVQVHGLSGGDTIQISESYDGTNSNVQSWIKNDFTTGSVISTDGDYSFSGGGFITYARTGNVSSPTLTICGNN